MKKHSFKLPILFFICTGIILLSLPGCGQNDENKKTDTLLAPTNQDEKPPIVMTDTPVANNSNQIVITKTDSVKQETKAVAKKETAPVKNQGAVAETPSLPDKKPITEPVRPPVEKVPEPVTTVPAPEPVPQKVEETKPALVVTPPSNPDKWIVPAKYINMANPYPADKESIDLGKSLYGIHCKSCHGSKGDGKGTKAATLDTKMLSFLSTVFQAQKPGEVYYKTVFGKGDMPKFEKKLPDAEDRWAVVNYIMNFKN